MAQRAEIRRTFRLSYRRLAGKLDLLICPGYVMHISMASWSPGETGIDTVQIIFATRTRAQFEISGNTVLRGNPTVGDLAVKLTINLNYVNKICKRIRVCP